MAHEPLSFELELEEQTVTISGGTYVLVELDGKERDKYLNSLGARVSKNAKGEVAGVKNFDGLQASLVSRCLYKVDTETGERTPVPIDTIQGWPARVVGGLYDAAKALCDLGEDEDEEGNE